LVTALGVNFSPRFALLFYFTVFFISDCSFWERLIRQRYWARQVDVSTPHIRTQRYDFRDALII